MIRHPITGEWWGTDEEIADALGAHIRPDTVRTWARRGRIRSVVVPGLGRGRGTGYYHLDDAIEEEHRTSNVAGGRPRATIALTG